MVLRFQSWSLMVIVVMISTGLCMFTYKSTQFNALGFIFLLIASLSSGIRWSFAQLIMQKSTLGLHNPIDMIYFMQPWMMGALLPLALYFESKITSQTPIIPRGVWKKSLSNSPSSSISFAGGRFVEMINSLPSGMGPDVTWLLIKITIGAFIAFAMEISEFMVLSYTSSLTLAIAGIFKVRDSPPTHTTNAAASTKSFYCHSFLYLIAGNLPAGSGGLY